MAALGTFIKTAPAPASSGQLPSDSVNSWSIGEMIAVWACATPEALAVAAGNETLSYGELDRKANQLANWLIAQGVTSETIVAICLDRSIAALVSALGVMKAGGAFMPLDPTHPSERLNFMLN